AEVPLAAEQEGGGGGQGGGFGFGRQGAVVRPGEYLVTIEAGGERMRRTVRVERAGGDPADARAETSSQES
ncbi:MAG: hypothetical protein AB1941_02530, partial [Gemmatimonadota bacterium]